jgi:hypothetical protein
MVEDTAEADADAERRGVDHAHHTAERLRLGTLKVVLTT